MVADPVTGISSPARRSARSRDGCLTCRRRKVRCNEIKPICGHCSRLNLECRWKPPSSSSPSVNAVATSAAHPGSVQGRSVHPHPLDGSSLQVQTTPGLAPGEPGDITALTPNDMGQQTFDDVFNYASFMWEGSAMWRSPPWLVNENPMMPSMMTPMHTTTSPPENNGHESRGAHSGDHISPSTQADRLQILGSSDSTIPPHLLPEERSLLEYFIQSVVPPILAEVETQQRWSSMRHTLLRQSHTSPILLYSILSFSSLLFSRQGDQWTSGTQKHYERATAELAEYYRQQPGPDASGQDTGRRVSLLGTLFFLSYTDLLESKTGACHEFLKKAFEVYQATDRSRLKPVELRLLSWIRLVDARAVSAGGEGLFLNETDEQLVAKASPATLENDSSLREDEAHAESDIEGVLFDILYEPGVVFFQKVQSYMGRISRLDPWHRSRGTVEDETEVMERAACIGRDLRQLYEGRPLLMDYAVAGSLTSAHVSANLAFTITRAFRTFLSNYHASRVHLHRVAYKGLPLTKETVGSIAAIRHLARSMVRDEPDRRDTLPVHMLWPLLMWGAEEKEAGERAWIRDQFARMEGIATNARITGQVLEEVQARQDRIGARQDIREVMEHIFHSCWAIV